jgi:hypothetical protein
VPGALSIAWLWASAALAAALPLAALSLKLGRASHKALSGCLARRQPRGKALPR